MAQNIIDTLISPELEKLLTSCTNLPSLPAVALKIVEASKDPDISLHEVSAIISSDPAISAKILKIANSPLYSQRRTLNNLREALTLLGFNAALTVALSFSLLQSLGSNKNHESFWKRSIISASIARILGSKLGVTKLEDLFLASLLQDIGVLVMECIDDSIYPEDSHDLQHVERTNLELEALGLEHSLIGAWLLKHWNLPSYLINSVMYSHSLNTNLSNQSEEDTSFHYCLNLSGNLADIWLTDNRGDLLLSILEVTKQVLSVDNEEFNEIIIEIDDALPAISDIFEVVLVGDKDREDVLHEARELLLERSIHTIKKSEDDRRYIESITDRVEKIEKESRLDHLTNVYNRQHIEKLLEIEFEESNINKWPLSVAFIDIDDFKLVNDTFGHLAGDEVLKSISNFFSKNIRQTDVLARYGGDEFILMLPGSTSEIAKSLLERLLSLFTKEVIIDVKGIEITTSVSIGLATHTSMNGFEKLKDVLAAADEALYRSKKQGKNCLTVF